MAPGAAQEAVALYMTREPRYLRAGEGPHRALIMFRMFSLECLVLLNIASSKMRY